MRNEIGLPFGKIREIPYERREIFTESGSKVHSKQGDLKRREEYKDRLAKGYVWKTNSHKDDVERSAWKYRSEGFEVIIEKIAFQSDGKILRDYRAILTRKTPD